MKKKKVEENKAIDIKEEIKGILDDNYFHINIRPNELFRGGIEWTVYYKNVNAEVFFSDKNKPLLTSRHNTIADIYILRDIFRELQDQIIEEEGFEFFRDNRKIYYLMWEIKERASLGMLNIFTIYVFVNLATVLIKSNIAVSFINLIACIGVAIFFQHKNKKLNKLLDNAEKETQDILLKVLIRGKGLGFVKEIRNRLKEEGVYKYGTNKKTGKTFKQSI